MDSSQLHSLLTSQGQQALSVAANLNPTEESFLTSLTQLGKQFERTLAKAALETIILRRKALVKFAHADAMYFTREGLEMATSEIVSRYRAQHFAPFKNVADLCCGLGGDAIGLAQYTSLTGVDLNPLHLQLAQFVELDLTHAPPPPADAYFFDPARRTNHKRTFSVKDYQPALALLNTLLPKSVAVKISPGVKLNELAAYDCALEFISVAGELKECVMWFNFAYAIKTRIATLLRPNAPPLNLIDDGDPTPMPITEPQTYLYEPDPAVLRAGLVTTLARQIAAHQIDGDIAYLTSTRKTATPWARIFQIEAALPFSQKRLREKLRAMNVGRVTIKKRGSPLAVEALAHALKLKGDLEKILFLTHVRGEPYVLIGDVA